MIEDGTMAGEGLTVLQTITYFVGAPILLFAVISFFAYVSAKETRKKSKKRSVDLTHIDQITYLQIEPLVLAQVNLYFQRLIF